MRDRRWPMTKKERRLCVLETGQDSGFPFLTEGTDPEIGEGPLKTLDHQILGCKNLFTVRNLKKHRKNCECCPMSLLIVR